MISDQSLLLSTIVLNDNFESSILYRCDTNLNTEATGTVVVLPVVVGLVAQYVAQLAV